MFILNFLGVPILFWGQKVREYLSKLQRKSRRGDFEIDIIWHWVHHFCYMFASDLHKQSKKPSDKIQNFLKALEELYWQDCSTRPQRR